MKILCFVLCIPAFIILSILFFEADGPFFGVLCMGIAIFIIIYMVEKYLQFKKEDDQYW